MMGLPAILRSRKQAENSPFSRADLAITWYAACCSAGREYGSIPTFSGNPRPPAHHPRTCHGFGLSHEFIASFAGISQQAPGAETPGKVGPRPDLSTVVLSTLMSLTTPMASASSVEKALHLPTACPGRRWLPPSQSSYSVSEACTRRSASVAVAVDGAGLAAATTVSVAPTATALQVISRSAASPFVRRPMAT